ncbi:DUF2252 family protein [Alteromonas sp. H39]|uniref:DUF2252 family protein n=1 Tax=Alteromonas sp. H39 TaxID=3389876 RepID=UPI0039E17C51
MNRGDYLRQHIESIDGPLGETPKHVKMTTSPFVFYRGTAQLFYADMASGVLRMPKAMEALPLVCVMGDCHASNFGFLTEEGSHGDNVIFAPNDFDDACVGHAAWDIMRFLVSLALTADHCEGVQSGRYPSDVVRHDKPAIARRDVEIAMAQFLEAYTALCARVIQSPSVIYEAIEQIPTGKLKKRYEKACRRAACGEDFTSKSALAKAVKMKGDRLCFNHQPDKFIPLDASHYQQLETTFAPYMDEAIVDIVARANAGTGSVNMGRYYFLVGPAYPHDETSFARCHIVEVKQQRKAAPLHYFPGLCPVNSLNAAHLTARCQRKIQRRPDLLLDEVEWRDAHWLIRSRHHAKVGIDPEDIGIGNKAVNGSFSEFASYCGKALALAHCRADRRSTVFEQQTVAKLCEHNQTLQETALAYYRQVLADYQLFRDMQQHN